LRSRPKAEIVAPECPRPRLSIGDPSNKEGDAGEPKDRYEQDSDLGRDVNGQNPEPAVAEYRRQKQDPADRVQDQKEGGNRMAGDRLLESTSRARCLHLKSSYGLHVLSRRLTSGRSSRKLLWRASAVSGAERSACDQDLPPHAITDQG